MNKVSSFTVIVTFVCLALVGLALIPLLPVKLNPSRNLPGFTVGFSMPGASSRVVEMEVTSKLESMLARIRGVKNLNSTSGNGSGSITVELDKHADVDAVRFEASTIIRQTWPQLPEGVSYPTIRMKTSDNNALRPFMSFTLNAPSTPILIQQYAEEHIKPQLARLPGVYKIDLSGATPMEWRLEYDSEQLRLLGVTLSDIHNAVRRYYRKEFLGTHNIDTGKGGEQWIRLALVPEIGSDVFDPSVITVTNAGGKILRLDELVKVTRMEEEPQSYYRINGLNSIRIHIHVLLFNNLFPTKPVYYSFSTSSKHLEFPKFFYGFRFLRLMSNDHAARICSYSSKYECQCSKTLPKSQKHFFHVYTPFYLPTIQYCLCQ